MCANPLILMRLLQGYVLSLRIQISQLMRILAIKTAQSSGSTSLHLALSCPTRPMQRSVDIYFFKGFRHANLNGRGWQWRAMLVEVEHERVMARLVHVNLPLFYLV